MTINVTPRGEPTPTVQVTSAPLTPTSVLLDKKPATEETLALLLTELAGKLEAGEAVALTPETITALTQAVSGTVALDPASLDALENITVTGPDLAKDATLEGLQDRIEELSKTVATEENLRRLLVQLHFARDTSDQLRVVASASSANIGYITPQWGDRQSYPTYYAGNGSPASMDPREQHRWTVRPAAVAARNRWSVT